MLSQLLVAPCGDSLPPHDVRRIELVFGITKTGPDA